MNPQEHQETSRVQSMSTQEWVCKGFFGRETWEAPKFRAIPSQASTPHVQNGALRLHSAIGGIYFPKKEQTQPCTTHSVTLVSSKTIHFLVVGSCFFFSLLAPPRWKDFIHVFFSIFQFLMHHLWNSLSKGREVENLAPLGPLYIECNSGLGLVQLFFHFKSWGLHSIVNFLGWGCLWTMWKKDTPPQKKNSQIQNPKRQYMLKAPKIEFARLAGCTESFSQPLYPYWGGYTCTIKTIGFLEPKWFDTGNSPEHHPSI